MFSGYVSFVFFTLWHSLSLSLSSMTLTLLKRLFCKLFFNMNFSVFSWLDGVYRFGWGIPQSCMSILVHCIRGFLRLICLITDGINLDHLLKVISTMFFYYKVNMIIFVKCTIGIFGDDFSSYCYAKGQEHLLAWKVMNKP